MAAARRRKPSARGKSEAPGRFARVAALMAAHPAASSGAVLMLTMATAIITNALALQPGLHPAPLFRDTRPVAADDPVAAAWRTVDEAVRRGEVGSIDDLVARTTGQRQPTLDSGLVSDIQAELKRRGYYDGEVDGMPGPLTAAAIVRFEEAMGIAPTGEPTGDVLVALRKGARTSEAEPEPPLPVVPTVQPRARPMSAAVPNHRPDHATNEIGGAPYDTQPSANPAAYAPRDSLQAEPAVVRHAPPESDPRLAKIQQSLDLLGYGPLRPDGFWSHDTSAAIRRFEENRGLAVTGLMNQAFLDELVKIGGLSLD